MSDQTAGRGVRQIRVLDFWRKDEVWFRDFIRSDRPWGDERMLDALPDEARGSYGIRSAQYVQLDGEKYEPGNYILVDSREQLLQLVERVPKIEGLIFPWYDRLVPPSLWLPHFARVDRATYRKNLGKTWMRGFLIAAGLVALGFAVPDLLVLALLGATIFGLFPLVDATMAWFRRVDRYSVEQLNQRLVNHELFQRWMVERPTTSLKVFVGVLALVFVGQMLVDGNTPPGTLPVSIQEAALVKSAVLERGEWWRLLTTGLMHGSVLHILFNGMALFSLGRVITALVSPALLSVVFVLTVLAGSAASLWMGPGPASVGASGGILGCLGFLLVVTQKFSSELPGFLRSSLIQSTIVVSIFGLLGAQFIDNAAHAGGFLGGVLIGVLGYRQLELAPARTGAGVRLMGWICNAILLAGLIQVARELLEA